jgi:hypothetical protein
MNVEEELRYRISRRAFFGRSATGIGVAALDSLLNSRAAASPAGGASGDASRLAAPHFAPRAKRVIFLFMSGGPSHVDLFDPKPQLARLDGQPMPPEIIKNHTFAMIKEAHPTIKGSPYKFRRHGESGQQISELLPALAQVADELAVVRSLYTDTFNHDPAVQFMNTGDVRFGRPSLGAWLSYGLGSECADLPAFIVLASGVNNDQPLLESYWGSGFLPTQHQGVQFRSRGEPVLFASNPQGINQAVRREMIDLIRATNEAHAAQVGDPEILTRIKQYEMAFKMQASVPELMDLAREPVSIHRLYGTQPGSVSFANNCLLARKLIERGVRFVQLYHKGWDSHQKLEENHARLARETDRAAAALLVDLKQRGLLDDTLVVWGGEFGRTPIVQGKGPQYGRDHHPYGFTVWLAGGGVKPGIAYGKTDEFGYFAIEDKIHIHDFNATILACLGIDHQRLTFRSQGRDYRLTDVHGRVVSELLS